MIYELCSPIENEDTTKVNTINESRISKNFKKSKQCPEEILSNSSNNSSDFSKLYQRFFIIDCKNRVSEENRSLEFEIVYCSEKNEKNVKNLEQRILKFFIPH